MICRMKKVTTIFCAAVFTATVTAAIVGSPVYAARMGPVSASVPETNSNFPDDLRLPDPHKDLRQLSKTLKLTKDQRDVIGSILEERTREIRLLLDVKALSEDFRDMLAAIVMNSSNAQIESLLRNKQKTKFDQELIQAQRLR
jgi:Spy/CpxP family protein refolding chaperone